VNDVSLDLGLSIRRPIIAQSIAVGSIGGGIAFQEAQVSSQQEKGLPSKVMIRIALQESLGFEVGFLVFPETGEQGCKIVEGGGSFRMAGIFKDNAFQKGGDFFVTPFV
jgi:hypothetical protein